MNIFSNKSKFLLMSCDERLIRICEKVLEVYDITIIQGHRTKIEQDAYFKSGRSKVQWPNSKHNSMPSKAVDIAPHPIDWANRERFIYLAGLMMATAASQGVKLRWGGNWDMDNNFTNNDFKDLGHFEIME